MSFEAVPTDLRSRDRWICWRLEPRSDGKKTKRPINPHTGKVDDATDSSVWTTLEEAQQAHAGDDIDTSGIGFVFTEEDTIAGVDIDDGRDPDTGEPVSEEVAEMVESANTYIEVSQSGTGYTGLLHGFVPDGGTRGDIDAQSHIELYDSGRFFVITGDHVEGTPTEINPRARWLKDLHAEYVADKEEKADDSTTTPAPAAPGTVDIDKEEVLERASDDDKFQRLWRGDTSQHNGDHSRADLALCNKLAFYTQGDRRLIDSLFRESGLMRNKWDVVHYSNGDTYGEGTIEEALDKQTEYYGTEPALADGEGGATTQQPAPTPNTTGTLTPHELALEAGLSEATEIADLNDREKAAFVWRLIKQSDDVHVRINRDNAEPWAFDPETGTWISDGERALRHAAKRTVADVNYGDNVLKELKTHARADPTVEVETDNLGLEAGKVAVENGLLDLEKAYRGEGDALRELKPEDYALSRLPVEYDPEADDSTWKEFVGDVVDSSMIHTVQEYIGDCLHRANRFERALLLVGDGANGKSTFLNTVEAFLGEDNTSSVSPYNFSDEPSLATMQGALANIAVELGGQSLSGENLSKLKSLTGGDSVSAQRKYKSPFKFTYDGGMLFATNEVPDVPVSDDDTAFWRRWIIVPFNNYFPEGSDKCDENIDERLEEPENLSALLNWAIEGWGRLTEHGTFDNAEDVHTTRQKWQQWGDSVADFLSNVVERDTDAPNISTGEAYDVYRQWCRENDRDIVGRQKFTNAGRETELGYMTSVRTDRKDYSVRGYKFFGTVDSERDPIEVIEEDKEEEADSNGAINSGLHEYDSSDSDDDSDDDSGEADKANNSSSATDSNSEAGEAGNNADNSGGGGTENTAPEGDHNVGDGGGGTWSKLLGDISKHYSDGEEITPEELVECVDRIDNTTYAEKGLEALADSGVIQREEEHYIA